MTSWRRIADGSFVMHCPIALRVLDEFIGRPPFGAITAALDVEDGTDWRATQIAAVRTPNGLYAYPGLGRQANAAGQPPTRYRVRLSAQFYRPEYGFNLDGLVFDVPPYNDSDPPAFVPVMPQDVILFPATNYPYPAHVRVLRGLVRDAGGQPLTDAKVSSDGLEFTLTNEDGAYSLPLRWPDKGELIQVDAEHWWTSTSDSINVQLPDGLEQGHVITVT